MLGLLVRPLNVDSLINTDSLLKRQAQRTAGRCGSKIPLKKAACKKKASVKTQRIVSYPRLRLHNKSSTSFMNTCLLHHFLTPLHTLLSFVVRLLIGVIQILSQFSNYTVSVSGYTCPSVCHAIGFYQTFCLFSYIQLIVQQLESLALRRQSKRIIGCISL